MLSRPRQTQQQEQPTASAGNTSVVTAPAIPLPKRDGAVRGIGEKFAATGPNPSGLGPQFNLACDSGSGNGPFGFGWSLSLLAITSKTSGRPIAPRGTKLAHAPGVPARGKSAAVSELTCSLRQSAQLRLTLSRGKRYYQLHN